MTKTFFAAQQKRIDDEEEDISLYNVILETLEKEEATRYLAIRQFFVVLTCSIFVSRARILRRLFRC